MVNCTFANSTSQYGTAIHSEYTQLSIINSTFENLHAKKSGGAITFVRISGEASLDNCSFINTTSDNNGGAICADISYYDLAGDGTLKINSSKFRNSKSKFGGALLSEGGFIKIYNTAFEDNCAEFSGGACYFAQSLVSIENATFRNNCLNNTDSKGSAVTAFGETVDISNSRFLKNPSCGIYIAQSTFNIADCYFENNTVAISTAYSEGSLDSNNCTADKISENDNDGYYVLIISCSGVDLDLIKNDIDTTSIPTHFDSREWGWVSHVKDQGYSGACWIFSTVSALETAILKSTGIEHNLSVEKIHKLISQYSKYGSHSITEGGFTDVAGHFLLSWYGALPAENDEFDLYGRIANPVISSDAVHVQDIVWIEPRKNSTDNDGLKKAIMKYGAVTSGINLLPGTQYYNEATSAVYYNVSKGAGHAICIVGWDDNYPAANFNITPPGDGAWIVKDSYGESARDHGYVYVSYYDTAIGYDNDNIAFVFDDWESYAKNYQTDTAGNLNLINTTIDEYKNSMDYENNTTAPVNYTYKNIYTAIGDDFISAVGTYFDLNEEYTVEIYVNGKLKQTQKGTAPFKGFHTVKLTQPVPVKAGDKFQAVMKKHTLPLIEDSEVIPQPGNSIADDGTGWMDLSEIDATASLKVYTKPLVNLTCQISAANVNTVYNGGKYLSVNVRDVFGNSLKGVKVTVRLSNGVVKTYTSDSKGQVKFSTDNLNVNTYTATITTESFANYLKTTSTAKITVKKATPKLTANSKTFKAKSKVKKLKVTLKDSRKKAIKNAKVTIKVKGKTYSSKTNSKGVATLKITKLIKKGTFKASVKFAGSKNYKAVTKTIKIKSK